MADEKSLEIFKKIHDQLPITITTLKLTHRQYYSRLARMTKVGLVYKSNRRFKVTSLGQILYGFSQSLRIGLDNESKLKAIDFLQMQSEVPKDELDAIIDILLNNKTRALISKEEGEEGQRTVSEILYQQEQLLK